MTALSRLYVSIFMLVPMVGAILAPSLVVKLSVIGVQLGWVTYLLITKPTRLR